MSNCSEYMAGVADIQEQIELSKTMYLASFVVWYEDYDMYDELVVAGVFSSRELAAEGIINAQKVRKKELDKPSKYFSKYAREEWEFIGSEIIECKINEIIKL